MKLKIDIKGILIWPFRMFSQSPIQTKGNNEKFFHIRNIVKYFTVSSDLDRRIQTCSFRKERVGISGNLNTEKFFAIFGQPGFQILCTKLIPLYLKMNDQSLVKSYRLIPWRKNEPGKAEDMSLFVEASQDEQHFSDIFRPSRVHCMDET